MSQTRAYSTGGTVHIVVNNQVGLQLVNKKMRDQLNTVLMLQK